MFKILEVTVVGRFLTWTSEFTVHDGTRTSAVSPLCVEPSLMSHMTGRALSPSRSSRTASTTNDYQLTASFQHTDRQTDSFTGRTMSWVTVLSVRTHAGTMWVSADASYNWTARFIKENGQLAGRYYCNCFSSPVADGKTARTQVCGETERAGS